ncbi:carbohydrate-binding module family 13 protein [Pleurotus ostreatus PC15]|uniref:Carbohydrate-binding module family 13 protein n=1 Tax=Pleurotus ostreatus (strain PC15) TaxID=1137138 RepID=A0A067NUJ0_PLEO1|nr:carbohydrate-binding module family 13 protein [Pleurotus ostreatus PC15]
MSAHVDIVARQGTTTTTSTSTSTTTSSSTSSSTSTSTSTATTTSTTTTASSSATSSANTATSTATSTSTAPPPNETTVRLHPNYRDNKCLDVRGNIRANGTPVQIYDCNGTGAQNWLINFGRTKVRLAGTDFCLDAGTNPRSGVGMKIWQCYANLPAQDFWYTDDQRIAVTDKGQCLDLTDGRLNNGRQAQTWKCTDFNTNQIWNI